MKLIEHKTLTSEFLNSHYSKGLKYTVNADGVRIEVSGEGNPAYQLPAFYFDGEIYTEIVFEENMLSISYKGWKCRYITNGKIIDGQAIGANRNGYYRSYMAISKNHLCITVEILKL